MAKRADIEAQIKALQDQLDADEGDEVWIKDDSGREFKVTGQRASAVLSRFSDLWESGDDQGDGGDQGDGDQDTPKDKQPPSGYFGRKGK